MGEQELLRKMARLLKSGATMLDQVCPNCRVPLFRLKSGEVVCPKCGQRFIIVQTDEEELEVRGNIVLQELERAAVEKLWRVAALIKESQDYSQIAEAVDTALSLLRVVDYSRRIRRESQSSGRVGEQRR